MKTQEKMRKPLLEAKYLNVENTDRYRPIIRLFYLQSEKLKYWLYQEEHEFYYAGDFDPEGLLIAQRLKKLERVRFSELQEIKELMLREKKAAYQEAMMGEYLCERDKDEKDEKDGKTKKDIESGRGGGGGCDHFQQCLRGRSDGRA